MEIQGLLLVVAPAGLLTPESPLGAIIFAYMGPDSIMPLGSAIAAMLGVALMFWHRGVRLVRNMARRLRGQEAVQVVVETKSSEGE